MVIVTFGQQCFYKLGRSNDIYLWGFHFPNKGLILFPRGIQVGRVLHYSSTFLFLDIEYHWSTEYILLWVPSYLDSRQWQTHRRHQASSVVRTNPTHLPNLYSVVPKQAGFVWVFSGLAGDFRQWQHVRGMLSLWATALFKLHFKSHCPPSLSPHWKDQVFFNFKCKVTVWLFCFSC